MARSYVVEGARLQCTLGTSPGKLKVVSQQKLTVQGKLKATNKDKLLEPPFFGSCTCKSPSPPCSPVFQEWQVPSKKASMGDMTFLMDDSKIQCIQGGTISIQDVNQDAVATGEMDKEPDKVLPKLEGEVIFVNGYLSNPVTNSESHYNAIMDKNPDNNDHGTLQGENTNEHNQTHHKDVYTANEHKERENRSGWEKLWQDELKLRLGRPLSALVRFSYTPEEKYRGYWNTKTNKMKGTEIYAEHFNARGNEHFINGSHGLGSSASHRIDHGIAQGYTWAKENWNIETSEYVENIREGNPYIETFSPAYKPVTIIGHSQGVAMAAGVAIGVLKYAADMGYEKIPLNLIFLGVHQPKNLTGEEYDQLFRQKTKYLEVDDFYLKLIGDGEQSGKEYLNSISDLFDPDHHKLKHERGIYEHLKKIVGDWPAFKERAVQFTFANDRGDLVLRDGDIPEIDSACHPERDTTLYSVEFFSSRKKIPTEYETVQGKKVIDLSMEEQGIEGFIVIPPYIANRRFDYDALEDLNDPTKEQKEHGVEWGDYKSVCIRWGIAMARYKKLKKEYNKVAKDKWYVPEYDRENNILLRNWEHLKVDWLYLQTARWYAPLQTADLYAHFSPVGLINHKRILSDFEKYCDDTVGTTESIWERIKKVGENKFYRVEFDGKLSSKNSDDSIEKRRLAKSEIETKLVSKQVNTTVGNTSYVKNVIAAFVDGNEAAAKELYREPINLHSGMKAPTKEEMQKITDKKGEQLFKLREVKKDNTAIRKLKDF
ncbi:MAG TPA: DUF4280 domain-containing protein [Pricia sp.]|nr:DUF4280 domain-containing protein [Pricia sp.]